MLGETPSIAHSSTRTRIEGNDLLLYVSFLVILMPLHEMPAFAQRKQEPSIAKRSTKILHV